MFKLRLKTNCIGECWTARGLFKDQINLSESLWYEILCYGMSGTIPICVQ